MSLSIDLAGSGTQTYRKEAASHIRTSTTLADAFIPSRRMSMFRRGRTGFYAWTTLLE
jgi:hypothetical protein